MQVWWLGLLFWMVPLAYAHPPGLSSLDIRVLPSDITVKATFAVQDIEAFVPMDLDLDAEVTDAERQAAKPAILSFLVEKLPLSVDDKPLTLLSHGEVEWDGQNNVHATWQFAGQSGQQLRVYSGILLLLTEGHQQYIAVHRQDGGPALEKILRRDQPEWRIAIDANAEMASEANSFADFFKLGVEHILTGYDHLLFLLALLAVTHHFWPALKIITFFTIAHSITLACAGLDLIQLPARLVEPVIAATIVYVGVENLIRGEHPKGRHWLTFAFGLMHGFGFAGVLQELAIASSGSGIVMPLLAFNLGIETGQISVAAVVLPGIWWLNSRANIAARFLKICSWLVTLMGCYWLIERILVA